MIDAGIKFAIFWICCGLLAAGFLNKSMDTGYHWSTKEKCLKWGASDQSFSIVIGVVGGPITLIASMAFTGFGYNGWSLTRHECKGYD